MTQFDQYTGLNIADRLGGCGKELFLTAWDYMHKAFGDNVEFELLAYMTLLCNKTKEYLYKKPGKTAYVKGSRPSLDRLVETVCKNAHTEREKVLALFAFVRDLHLKSGRSDYFYGGTEEEQIKKGEFLCERVSRLMVALCEVSGIPARIVFHLSSGHVITEIYLEENWAYFDPRFGVFFVDENDKFLSVLDIRENPEVIYQQPQWVQDYCNLDDPYDLKECHDRYLSKKEIHLYGEYSLTHAERYHYEWTPSDVFPMKERDEAADKYHTLSKQYFTNGFYIDSMEIE